MLKLYQMNVFIWTLFAFLANVLQNILYFIVYWFALHTIFHQINLKLCFVEKKISILSVALKSLNCNRWVVNRFEKFLVKMQNIPHIQHYDYFMVCNEIIRIFNRNTKKKIVQVKWFLILRTKDFSTKWTPWRNRGFCMKKKIPIKCIGAHETALVLFFFNVALLI